MSIKVQESWIRANPSSIGLELIAETDVFAASLTVSRGAKGEPRVPFHSDGVAGLEKGDVWVPAASPWAVGAEERCELLLGILKKGAKVKLKVTIGDRDYGPYDCEAGDEFLSARFKLFVG